MYYQIDPKMAAILDFCPQTLSTVKSVMGVSETNTRGFWIFIYLIYCFNTYKYNNVMTIS